MSERKLKLPKKGGAKRVAESFRKLRERPLSKEVFDIVEANYERMKKEKSEKKSAKPRHDKGVYKQHQT